MLIRCAETAADSIILTGWCVRVFFGVSCRKYGAFKQQCGFVPTLSLKDCMGHPDLWRADIGLAEDWLSQQQNAGEKKENGDKAEGGVGCGHGLAPWNYFSVPGASRCSQWLASLKWRDSCHGSGREGRV
jgi:hypothetical protein